MFSLYLADRRPQAGAGGPVAEGRELPFVQDALASIEQGGYPEALARVACLLARKGEPVLLSRLRTKAALIDDYRELLPAMPPDQWRRVRGEQEIIVRYAPEEALSTLPALLRDAEARRKLDRLVEHLQADPRVRRAAPTAEQRAMLDEIRRVLATSSAAPVRTRKGGRAPQATATGGRRPRRKAASATRP